MLLGGVAVLTLEVIAIAVHMHIRGLVRVGHGRVEIAMLDRISSATVEVAAAAVIPNRLADILGDPQQIQGGIPL
ncbi:hypothetical protein TUM3811_05510 [Shewanella algae]|nr:hypothetical protein TUM3811_05510 [Shewanella algae]